ncbi:MAG: hypothetical protein BGP24_14615 [Lysobacterales bacterium 69-70]|nr:hypothetical protein [Xanthomonadaceae bacterium]ODU35321.1 MAG: hypothetical protein ABS97_05450 [Xanthomonadaceae bacterium SCN 69-320]ODV17215.1 MAG: hypothetical protein ABT27_17790 [Xanthomonadaceae bacterium SCN 69-25]OJY94217.1 MAG: hypothetical protein BGP24_14615 [Xanthomonadales bacterium 69-70]
MALPLNSHTNQYVFGRGKLFVNKYANGVYEGRRFIGNCPGFTLTVESQKYEHFNSTSAIRTKDFTKTISVNFNAQITCDDFQNENVAMFVGGTLSDLAQSATPVTNEPIVVNKGFHYQLGLVGSNKVGVREVSSVTITDVAGTTTYVLNTDYSLDADSGMFYVIPGGAITNGQTVHADYTAAAGDRKLITSGNSGSIDAEIFFVADNGGGDNRDLRIPLANIAPSGDMAFITEEEISQMVFDIGASLLNAGTAAIYIAGQNIA